MRKPPSADGLTSCPAARRVHPNTRPVPHPAGPDLPHDPHQCDPRHERVAQWSHARALDVPSS